MSCPTYNDDKSSLRALSRRAHSSSSMLSTLDDNAHLPAPDGATQPSRAHTPNPMSGAHMYCSSKPAAPAVSSELMPVCTSEVMSSSATALISTAPLASTSPLALEAEDAARVRNPLPGLEANVLSRHSDASPLAPTGTQSSFAGPPARVREAEPVMNPSGPGLEVSSSAAVGAKSIESVRSPGPVPGDTITVSSSMQGSFACPPVALGTESQDGHATRSPTPVSGHAAKAMSMRVGESPAAPASLESPVVHDPGQEVNSSSNMRDGDTLFPSFALPADAPICVPEDEGAAGTAGSTPVGGDETKLPLTLGDASSHRAGLPSPTTVDARVPSAARSSSAAPGDDAYQPRPIMDKSTTLPLETSSSESVSEPVFEGDDGHPGSKLMDSWDITLITAASAIGLSARAEGPVSVPVSVPPPPSATADSPTPTPAIPEPGASAPPEPERNEYEPTATTDRKSGHAPTISVNKAARPPGHMPGTSGASPVRSEAVESTTCMDTPSSAPVVGTGTSGTIPGSGPAQDAQSTCSKFFEAAFKVIKIIAAVVTLCVACSNASDGFDT